MASGKYVRFVTTQVDPNSGRRQGLFQAAGALSAENRLSGEDLSELQALRAWFNANLNAPDRFSRSRRSGAASKAISWFKSTATGHVGRMYAMCRVLNRYGIVTAVVVSGRPGYVVFEDEHQVSAEPFAETVT